MKSNLFLPKKINVGFQARKDTYTGQLGYIIYFDEKGKLRKESSWNSWRDNKIANIIYDNEPTEGFVLNKKAGGYPTGWNYRQTYVRVYDPRGFEFEITVSNLLYILENTNSLKGKGLEGEFVYGWDKKDLVLVPTSSPDYIELTKVNELIHKKEYLTGRELKEGSIYLTRSNQELIYMGKHEEYCVYSRKKKKKKSFFFFTKDIKPRLVIMANLGNKIVTCLDEDCIITYPDLLNLLEHQTEYSPIDKSKDRQVLYTLEELEEKYIKDAWFYALLFIDGEYKRTCLYKDLNGHYYYKIKNPNYYNRNNGKATNEPYHLKIELKDITEVIVKLKPIKIARYLANGNFFKFEDYIEFKRNN